MDRNFLATERTPRELILFGAVSLGLLVSIVGVILSSVPLALTGFVLGGLGLGGFAVRKTTDSQ